MAVLTKKEGSRIAAGIKGLLSSPFHPDFSIRKMSFVFFGSLICLGFVLTQSVRTFRDERAEKERQTQELARQAAMLEGGESTKTGIHAEVVPMQNLGTFVVELKEAVKTRKVQMDVAEVEVIAECENKEVCSLLESRPNEARDAVVSAFSPVGRADLLSADGKRRLKKRILQKLNLFVIREGRVRRIFFGKLLVS